jgi:alpha 1,2-mannosyltransferase
VKAGFVVLAQESDLFRLRTTIMDVENHFNAHRHYPWIIIGDKLFSNRFRYWIENTSKAPVFFGQAPAIEWQEPYWVDLKKAEHEMKDMMKISDTEKTESMSWRRMTR